LLERIINYINKAMKQILTTLSITLVIMIATRCNQNSPAPSNGGSSNGTNNTTTMTPLETSLVGSWKLKRTESRSAIYFSGFGDSTISYINHYNYYNSILELKSTPSSLAGYYEGVFGSNDVGGASQIYWKGGPNNSITANQSQSFFVIKYLSTDSLILDMGGLTRLFYNKNTITPKMNNIELQLLGNPWQLISQNGVTAPYPTYLIFKNNWVTGGYNSADSVVLGVGSVQQQPWEVLYPNRTVPILFRGSLYRKIISITPNSLRLELIGNPTVNSVSSQTLIYSR
jgi:hypothetical protein